MAKLVEDSRVMTFAQNTLVPHDTYLNEIQDQLRGTHKTRQLCIDGNALDAYDSAPDWHWTTNDYFETTTAGGILKVHVPLIEGQKITQIDFSIYGATVGAPGLSSIYLKKRQLITGTGNAALNAVTNVQQLGGATPWSTNSLWDRVTTGSLAIIIDNDYRYFIEFGSTSGALTKRIADIIITAQFGN